MYQTVTLTGTYQFPDGSPAEGVIEIIPSEKQILDDAGNKILSGRVKVKLAERSWPKVDEEGQPVLDGEGNPVVEVGGHFSVDLPATDDPALTPTGFGYTVVAKLHHMHLPAASFSLPAALVAVDVTDVMQVDPSTFAPDANYITDTELEAALAGVVPDTSAIEADVTALDARVGTVEGEVASKADSSDVTALDGRVDSVEGEVAGRLSEASLSATYAVVLTAKTGETASATTTRINAALSAGGAFGARKRVTLVGDFTHNAALIVPSNTELDATQATLTLASNSLDNGIVNAAVKNNRRVMDAVTTASSTTLTSATAAFVAGDVGKTITVWNPAASGGKHTTTIASVTNGTTVVLTSAPTVTGAAQYASIGSRDSNIVVRLGRVVRQASNFVSPSNGWLSNHVRFRHLDNVDFDVEDINVTSGKYAVNFGDCTGVRVRRIYASYTASDVLHINGPCSDIRVDEVASAGSGDDIVSLTGGDFTTVHQMADCQGDITDMHVGTIRTKPSTHVPPYTRALLLLAGRNSTGSITYALRRITADRIDSELEGWPVMVGDDTQDYNTQGGSFEDITIGSGTNRPKPGGTAPSAFVGLRHNTMTRVYIGPVRNIGGTYDVMVDTIGTVDGLTVVGTPRSRIRRLGTVKGEIRILGDTAYGAASQVSTIPREVVGVQSVTAVSGTVYLMYFRPRTTMTVSSLTTKVRGTAAAGTTLAKYGIYEVGIPSTADDLTLIASTNNDTSMWASTFAGVGRNLTAPVTLDPFKTYAAALLFVGTTAPALIGVQGDGSELSLPDRLAMCRTGQTDLPATISWSSLSSGEGKIFYARLS